MMISRLFRNISGKLSNFNLILELSFEARKEDLSLPWFESVAKTRDGSCAVSDRELDKLLVDKVFIS